MEKRLLLGDEAIAQAAIDAGISGMYAYPGTPSTEIMEFVQNENQNHQLAIHAIWSANEKTALESALGMSYAGKRALVAMKHVGLNVAADPFMNASVTGVNGGLVIVSADDPSMHSSQNEQDSRFYGKFALIPVLEPSNQQEAYNMTLQAFEISEKYKVPVLLRITTRLAHSRSVVERVAKHPQKEIELPQNSRQFILLPFNARIQYRKLLSSQNAFVMDSENSEWNKLMVYKKDLPGIIACGIAWNYVMECIQDKEFNYNILKIGHYPFPAAKIDQILKASSSIMVFEEGYPLLEEMLQGFIPGNVKISGRLDGALPRDGELNPGLVAKALGFDQKTGFSGPSLLVPRPPSLCNGCSHADLYNALNEAMKDFGKGKVFSDIGCYTLGALEPFNAINSCVDMGASITMAKGAADAGLSPAVCVIGDSTFTHSGMTGLLDAVVENSPITVIISDNSTTGMTGGQESSAFGRLTNICKGLGVEPDHLITIVPLNKNHEANVKIIRKELEYKGVSVIIAQRECIQTATRRKKNAAKH